MKVGMVGFYPSFTWLVGPVISLEAASGSILYISQRLIAFTLVQRLKVAGTLSPLELR